MVALSFLAAFHCQGGSSQKEELDLKKVYALDKKVSVLAPSYFEWMSRSVIRMKYPNSSNPPTAVLTNKSASVNIAFNLNNQGIAFSRYEQFKSLLVQVFESQMDNIQWITKKIQTINGRKFVVLELISPAVDTDIYNLMMFTTTDAQKGLMVSFNCIKKDSHKWQDVAYALRDSVVLH